MDISSGTPNTLQLFETRLNIDKDQINKDFELAVRTDAIFIGFETVSNQNHLTNPEINSF